VSVPGCIKNELWILRSNGTYGWHMVDDERSGPSPRLTARGAATRERIVSAAADLMYAQGVAGTSLGDVMAASGTGPSQLYHYFTDKDALVAEVVLTQIARTLDTQQRLLGRVTSLSGLRRWRDAEVLEARSRRSHGCPLGSLASELSCRSEHSRLALAEAMATWEGYLGAAMRRIQAQGQLRTDADPAMLATGILAALEGGLLLAQTSLDPTRLERSLDAALLQLGS
jgi:TetR/AcrR family transcriptional regulator, transcriptional repressor for nem operon